MPKKKPSGTKKPVVKKKPVLKKAARKAKVAVRGKTASKKKTISKKVSSKKLVRVVKKASSARAREIRSPEPSTLDGNAFVARTPQRSRRGTGAAAAGQSGDLQGLSRREDLDSESVEELLEEGQSYEAGVISGIENALDPDQGEVETRETPTDDVPGEYTDED